MVDIELAVINNLVDKINAQKGKSALIPLDESPKAMAWNENQLTVRVEFAATDEVWIMSGHALLLRIIADSEGGFDDDIFMAVNAILDGHATEYFNVTSPGIAVPVGWEISSSEGSNHASGQWEGADFAVRLVGRFG